MFYVTGNANPLVQHVIQIKNVVMMSISKWKVLYMQKKVIDGILSHVFARIIDIYKVFLVLVFLVSEIISVLVSVSINVTNNISTNVTCTVSVNSDNKKK